MVKKSNKDVVTKEDWRNLRIGYEPQKIIKILDDFFKHNPGEK